jgi:hypothetical protein
VSTGDDHFPFFGDQDTVVALTQEFLTGATPVRFADRGTHTLKGVPDRWQLYAVELTEPRPAAPGPR